MFLNRAMNRFFARFHLRYRDAEEEQEFEMTRNPILIIFFQYLLLAITVVLALFVYRYYQIDNYPQAYILSAVLGLGIVAFLFKKYFEKIQEFILWFYIVLICGTFLYSYYDNVNSPQQRSSFYAGYGFAMITRLIGYRVLKFKAMLVLYLIIIPGKFVTIENSDWNSSVRTILLDLATLFLSLKSELDERTLFDVSYKAKKSVLKFKQILTQYLPNQMAIFHNDYSNAYYINNAFKRTFKVENLKQAKDVFDKFYIEKETIDKNKAIFTSLGCEVDDNTTEVSLAQFMNFLSQNVDMLGDLGMISFPVIEEDKLVDGNSAMEGQPQKDKTIEKDSIPKIKERINSKEKEETSHLVKENIPPKKESKTTPKNTKAPEAINESHKSSEKASSKTGSSDPGYEEGTKRLYKVKIFPILWDDSEAIAMVMDDITQQKIIMELKVADKNKDLVIAMVSHELRTPLNGMLGLLDIAKKSLRDQESLAYLDACRNSGLLMLNLVNSILDLHQIRNKKIRLVYSQVWVEDLLLEIKSLFDYFCRIKKLFLNIEIMPNVPKAITTDKDRLSQILVNLVGNAFKFTFRGGVALKVELENEADPSKVLFSVEDTGIGIDKEDQDRLFRMFGKIEHQDKNINSKGIGLGLTISNSLAELLNPTAEKPIKVKSEPLVGTCFSFVVQSHHAQKHDSVSLADISSVNLYEDKETTVMKKMGIYTINNNDNFTKMSYSRGDSNPMTTLPNRVATSDIIKGSSSLNFVSEEYIPLKSSSRPLLRGDSTTYKVKDSTSLNRNLMYQEVEEEKDDEIELEEDPNYKELKKPWCLVVDDNPFNLMVACHIMEERGYQVKTALNGQEAIQKVKEHDEGGLVFKVILMDCQMPVLDGYQATRIIKKLMRDGEVRDCPIIALTANNRNDEHEKLCQEVGMTGHVAKPLQINELEMVLKQVHKDKEKRISSGS